MHLQQVRPLSSIWKIFWPRPLQRWQTSKIRRRFVVVAGLSHNAVGKLQKNLLHARYGHLLATGAA